jgi:hypothetical protein
MRDVIVIVLLVFCLVSGCAMRLARMTDTEKAERLAAERSRVHKLKDEVAKTRSYIIISEILLDFASSALRNNDLTNLQKVLQEYATAIVAARDTMWDSDRDALRHPAGYRDLELSLRGQLRRLRDMSTALPFNDRSAVEAALQRATSARNDMLDRLFPQRFGRIPAFGPQQALSTMMQYAQQR